MNELAEEERFAVLYPEQDQRSNPLRCWNWFDVAALEGQGEALTIARLVERISARRVIDPQRVSVVGMSAGGAMACILSARHGRLFTACAVHSGLMYGAANSVIQALTVMRSGPSVAAIERAQELLRAATEIVVPTLVIQGDHDTTVHPSNAPAIIAQLRSRTEVIDSMTLARLDEHRIEDRGRPYRQQDYVRGRQVILREILIEGLGHAWSGGDPRHPFNDAAGPDASRLIVSFVTAQRPLA